MSLLRAAASVSGMTLLSRITGFARDTLIAVLFGAGALTDAFFVAFRIPNLLRRLFAEGAFSQAFVPVLGEYRTRRGDEATRVLAGKVLAVLSVVLFVATLIGVVAAPAHRLRDRARVRARRGQVRAHGDDAAHLLPVHPLRLAGVVLGGRCSTPTERSRRPPSRRCCSTSRSSRRRSGSRPHLEQPVVALAWGVFAGGVAQLLFQIPFLRHVRMLPRPRWDPRDEGVRRILRLMAPAALGVSVAQISLLINTQIASLLGDGAVSWLYYADRLMEFPVGDAGRGAGHGAAAVPRAPTSADDPAAYSGCSTGACA